MALQPLGTIGIVGGGQLGRMLAMAASRLGFRTAILDPQENAPAFQQALHRIVAPYDDIVGLQKLAELSDVITYEFENVPVTAFRELGTTLPVYPGLRALEISQDRLIEKNFFNELGIATAPYFDINDVSSLKNALSSTSGEGIVKIRRLGYDGKGQIRLAPEDQTSLKSAGELVQSVPCILEGMVGFEREVSVIAARGTDGQTVCFEPAENVHREGILRTSTVPANITSKTAAKATDIAEQVLAALDYVGVTGIEFFVMDNGELIVNEFAPRVHNSGHWSEAACAVSQFEQHIRAVSGLRLAHPGRHSDCIMENLIGDDMDKVPGFLGDSNVLIHLYGKSETRPGRKMGHITRLSPKQA